MTFVAVARADLHERARRLGLLVALGLAAVAAHVAIPAADAGYVTLSFPGTGGFLYRGIYNSGWVGTQTAVLAAIFLPFFGFYLVRGSIESDRVSGVGEIVAATPAGRFGYVMGKFLSNWTVLALVVAALAAAAAAIQLARGEDPHIDPLALLSPFLLLTLPVMAVAAALAVLFDCQRRLRGTRGDVVFFLLYVTSVGLVLAPAGPWLDWTGLHLMTSQLGSSGLVPGLSERISVVNVHFGTQVHPFAWGGLRWTAEVLASRLVWVGAAVGVAAIGALFFERFDPAVEPLVRPTGPAAVAPAVGTHSRGRRPVQLHSVGGAGRWSFGRVLEGELRLLAGGLPWWWYAGAVGLVAGTVLAPLDAARGALLPLAWIWPLAVWSRLGSQEEQHGVRALVSAVAHPLARQVPAQWLAGVAVSVAATGGMALRLIVAGDPSGVLGLWAGALVVPALALAAGTWTGSPRPFQVLLLIVWYVGVWQHEPALDFGATTAASVAVREPGLLALLAVILLAAAVVGRKRWLLRD